MAIIRGTAADDTLRGTLDADTIFGFGGDDGVLARAGNDTVHGGPGSDTVNGELGNDRLFGDAGVDYLTGGRGNDRVFGGAGSDFLLDRANGPDGNDAYDGGDGQDIIGFENQDVGVNLTLAEGGADSRAVQGGEVDILRAIEDVVGSRGDDVMFGNSRANSFNGTGGSDRIFARGGDDYVRAAGTLDGGAGNDMLGGQSGLVRMFGGTGADNLVAGAEFTTQPGDVDRSDLGSDADRDTFNAGIEFDFNRELELSFGVERVTNVRPQDQFNILYIQAGDIFVTAGEFLDSDGNGVVNDADRDARLVGSDLVLDIDQLFEREFNPPADLGEQHVILANLASIDADQFL